MTEPTLADAVIAATITMLATGHGALPFVFVREFPRHPGATRLGVCGRNHALRLGL